MTPKANNRGPVMVGGKNAGLKQGRLEDLLGAYHHDHLLTLAERFHEISGRRSRFPQLVS